jgi:hypothetical protein
VQAWELMKGRRKLGDENVNVQELSQQLKQAQLAIAETLSRKQRIKKTTGRKDY